MLYRLIKCKSGRVPQLLRRARSEEHTSELQSHSDLVCRLLLEKKKKKKNQTFEPWLTNKQHSSTMPAEHLANHYKNKRRQSMRVLRLVEYGQKMMKSHATAKSV